MTASHGVAARHLQTIGDLDRITDRVAAQMEKAARDGDDANYDAVALNLQGFYTAIEPAFEAVAANIDGGLPAGPNRHMELLRRVSFAIDPIRPAVISERTRDCLHEYRRFRHVVRNAYAFHLDVSRVREIGSGLPGCVALVKDDLGAFVVFLRALDEQSEPRRWGPSREEPLRRRAPRSPHPRSRWKRARSRSRYCSHSTETSTNRMVSPVNLSWVSGV